MYDESKVRMILRRATEIDVAKSSSMTRHEIMQVASELEISRDAVEQALREADAERMQVAPPAKPAMSTLRVINLSAGAGVAYGLLMTGTIVPHMGLGVAIGGLWTGLLMVSGGLAVAGRASSLTQFVSRNAALWLGVGFGWLITAELALKLGLAGGSMIQPSIVRTLMAFAVTSLGGIAFMAFSRMRRPADTAANGGSGTSGVARVWTRAKRWIRDRIVERLVIRVRVPRVWPRST